MIYFSVRMFFDSLPESVVEAPHFTAGTNEEPKTLNRIKTHDKETHGTSNDFDESTPVEKVKGPNMFERAKEEIEALVEAIHPKKEHDHKVTKDKLLGSIEGHVLGEAELVAIY